MNESPYRTLPLLALVRLYEFHAAFDEFGARDGIGDVALEQQRVVVPSAIGSEGVSRNCNS